MRTWVCSALGFVPRHCPRSPENSAMRFHVIFTYVIGFIFLVNAYVLSNCYVHSTVLASLEITVRSLPSRWEVLRNPGQTMWSDKGQDPHRCCGGSEEGWCPHGLGSWNLITGAPLPLPIGLAAKLLSALTVAPQSSREVTFPPLCGLRTGVTLDCCLPLTAPLWKLKRKENPSSLGCWQGGRRHGTDAWPISGPLPGPWILSEWHKHGGPFAGSNDHGE